MANGDVMSMVLAGLALLLAAVVAVMLLRPARHRAKTTRSVSLPLEIRLVPSEGTDPTYWWRFEIAAEAPPTEINIFSFRDLGTARTEPWQHELMEETLMLVPAQQAYLRVPAETDICAAYEVSIGWTIHRADATVQGSAITTIEPEPNN